MEPGWKTSELYVALSALVFATLVAFGLRPDAAEPLSVSIVKGVVVAVAALAQAVVLVTYIKGRVKLKIRKIKAWATGAEYTVPELESGADLLEGYLGD